MKYKIRMVLVLLLMLIGAIVVTQFVPSSKHTRIIQHETAQNKKETNIASDFSTSLPIITIDTYGMTIPGGSTEDLKNNNNEMIPSSITITDHDKKMNHIEDKPTQASTAQISYRGNSSRRFDKKPLKIKFDHNVRVIGMAKDVDWVLNGPILDRTLIRNYLSYNIAGQIMDYAPNCKYFELFVNHEYQGVYLAIESIKKGQDRVNIENTSDDTDVTSYIVRWDRSFKGDHQLNNFSFYTKNAGVSALDVLYPGSKKITDGKMKYIEKNISEIEKTLYSYDLNYSTKKNYEQYLDRNAFAQYFIINEFFSNVDAGRFSTYYAKDVKGKLKPIVWDFNNAGDNYMDYVYGSSGFSLTEAPWFNMLLKDEKFVSTVVEEYKKLREGVLSDAYIMKFIDDTQTFLGPAIDRNYQKWGYVFDLNNWDDKNFLIEKSRNLTSYEASIGQLKGWIKARGKWLDKHIDSLYQYCQDSKTKNSLLR